MSNYIQSSISLEGMSYNQGHFARVLLLVAVIICSTLNVSCSSSEESLTVYSGRSETLVKPIIDRFVDHTGIEVVVKYASTTELVSTLLEERSKSPADLFLAQDPGGLGAVDEMFALLPEATLDGLPIWARSDDGTWVGLSGRARTVVYNTSVVNIIDFPTDLRGFTDPVWKGRVGWAPRNGSFQTMVSAMRHLWGEDETKDWLEEMYLNDAQEYSNNSSQVVAVAAGEIDVGLVNHYYLHRLLAEKGELDAANHHLVKGGPGSLIMVAGIGILNTSSNLSNAQKFIEFMLSDEAQQYFAEKTFEYPVITSVQIRPDVAALGNINNPVVPLAKLADLKGTQTILREVGLIP